MLSFLRRKRRTWLETTTHDIGIICGGHVIHYSTCWCRKAV